MSIEILRCCANEPIYEIKYLTGDSFLVCSKCFGLPFWNRHVKDNKPLDLSDDKKPKREITVREKMRSDA